MMGYKIIKNGIIENVCGNLKGAISFLDSREAFYQGFGQSFKTDRKKGYDNWLHEEGYSDVWNYGIAFFANSDKKGRLFRTNGALIPFLMVQSTAPWDNNDYLSVSRMLIPFISSR